jgi:hypothetical protein
MKDPNSGYLVYNYIDPTGMVRALVRDSVFIGEAGEDNIPIMQPVYDCGSDNQVPLVCVANSGSISTLPAVGITVQNSTATGDYTRVMQVGLLENVNTSAWSEGDMLYISNVGGLTNVKPIPPALSQEIGVVLVKSSTVGKIQVISKSVTGNEFGTINNFQVVGNLTAPNICYSNGTGCHPSDNSSWNQTLAETLYAPISTISYNTTFNQTLTTSLYSLISEPIATANGNYSANGMPKAGGTFTGNVNMSSYNITNNNGSLIYWNGSCNVVNGVTAVLYLC